MTDSKPATPATEPSMQQLLTRAINHNHDASAILCVVSRRIADDAEIIKAARQERDAVKEALVEARETINAERARADKYEAESEQKGADLMAAESVIAEQAEDIEALRTAFGLLSTLAPKVVMAPASPAEVVATAKEIHKSVSEEIEKLKAERVEK